VHQLLKDPKKRRQLIIAGGAVVILVLLLVLHKKSSSTSSEPAAETTAASPAEPLPTPEGGGSGTTGAAGEIGQLGTQLSQQIAGQGAEQQKEIGELATALSQSYTNDLPPAAETTPAAAPTQAKTPLANAHLLTNEQAGNPRSGEKYSVEKTNGGEFHKYTDGQRIFVPDKKTADTSQPAATPTINTDKGNARKGLDYTETTYKGKKAHAYRHAVKGGVGPRHNLIIV
jgi:hypothetical protein